MQNSINIKDKQFLLYITQDQLYKRILELAEQINRDYKNRTPLFIVVLNGSFLFAADLIRNVDINCGVSFVKLASYDGTGSNGIVKELIGMEENVKGKELIIIEDIVDTGRTMKNLVEKLQEENPAGISIVSLLFKKKALIEDVVPDYVMLPLERDAVTVDVVNQVVLD